MENITINIDNKTKLVFTPTTWNPTTKNFSVKGKFKDKVISVSNTLEVSDYIA